MRGKLITPPFDLLVPGGSKTFCDGHAMFCKGKMAEFMGQGESLPLPSHVSCYDDIAANDTKVN